jgi:hypothetical protein
VGVGRGNTPENARNTRDRTGTTNTHAATTTQPSGREGRDEDEDEDDEPDRRTFAAQKSAATGRTTAAPLPLALSLAHSFESHAQTKRNDFLVGLTPPTSDKLEYKLEYKFECKLEYKLESWKDTCNAEKLVADWAL